MRIFIFFLAALLAVPSVSAAQPAPVIAPAPDWVEPLPIPEPATGQSERPLQMLLLDSQSRYGTEHNEHYLHTAALVQNQQGLQLVGNIILPWDPDDSELIVHQIRILRQERVIDLLAQGQEFAVLRRENQLEAAVLDGTLTAVMQAEGLTVGDVLDLAYTIRRRPGALPLRTESLSALPYGTPIGRFHVRQIWPTGMAVRWRGEGPMQAARTRSTRLGTELVLDLANAEAPRPPEGAPARFLLPARLEISQSAGWPEVSALIAPHYRQAATLAEGSPLQAHIDRIAAASADPRARALAALRLVQDEIRYFAVAVGDGSFIPASADETWTRRYGDCKGKTATLLALLHGLGIDAEPVLVNIRMGDLLGSLLPQMAVFDHVLVRARIEGRSYWLDGTRTADRDLDDLASSTLGWGLPIRPEGADLEALPFAPPPLPLITTNVTYDGSRGFDGEVPFTIESLYRGDAATAMRMTVSQVGRQEFLRARREAEVNLNGTQETVTDVDFRDDPQQGTFTLIVRGQLRMGWIRNPGAPGHRFQLDNTTVDWDADFDRPSSPFPDAPWTLQVPTFNEATETIILPDGGRGFSIEGESFERELAGSRLARRLSLADGRAVARLQFAHLRTEISAADGQAAVEALRAITDDSAFLVAPAGAVRNAPPESAQAEPQGASASALLNSGYEKMNAGRPREALEDFNRALALAPDSALAHGNRAIALLHLQRDAEARAALAQAMRRDPDEFVVHQGYGFLHLQQGHPEDAIPALTRAIEIEPSNAFSLGLRAAAYRMLDRNEEALADLERILRDSPLDAIGQIRRAALLFDMGRADEALAGIEAAQDADPANALLASQRADMLARLGRSEEATNAYGEALRMHEEMISRSAEGHLSPEEMPVDRLRMRLLARAGRSGEALDLIEARLRRYPGNYPAQLARCWLLADAGNNLQRALSDCNRAREFDPGDQEAMAARGFVYLRLQRWDDAVREFDQALALAREDDFALYGRGLARMRSGQEEAGAHDLTRARRLNPTIEWEYGRLGLAPVTVASSGS